MAAHSCDRAVADDASSELRRACSVITCAQVTSSTVTWCASKFPEPSMIPSGSSPAQRTDDTSLVPSALPWAASLDRSVGGGPLSPPRKAVAMTLAQPVSGAGGTCVCTPSSSGRLAGDQRALGNACRAAALVATASPRFREA
eukprot:CAMPEP_0182913028 /NCGR_PEP_ID=MMETSP0034_2-20130328/37825_1 /TAXON_ID=156128 /ORGANISM="Nephroselmis pyriformis, Strain CCMP717" /LENGTH=142 /DNA_ID=CAMNT_0025049729 /DNA_START=67 /DNA_END=496 /DNA_ORIENTATION=+